MQMKIIPGLKMKAWFKRFNTFLNYLLRCLWLTGAQKGKWPEAYDKDRERNMLEFLLSIPYLTAHFGVDWWYKQTHLMLQLGS